MQIRSDRDKSDIILSTRVLLLINSGERDDTLELLLESAYSYACAYTGREEIPSAVLIRMVCEDYSKSSGITKKTRAGMSEEYIDGYSESVMCILRSMKRLKAV